jgi:hypothetical protein
VKLPLIWYPYWKDTFSNKLNLLSGIFLKQSHCSLFNIKSDNGYKNGRFGSGHYFTFKTSKTIAGTCSLIYRSLKFKKMIPQMDIPSKKTSSMYLIVGKHILSYYLRHSTKLKFHVFLCANDRLLLQMVSILWGGGQRHSMYETL